MWQWQIAVCDDIRKGACIGHIIEKAIILSSEQTEIRALGGISFNLVFMCSIYSKCGWRNFFVFSLRHSDESRARLGVPTYARNQLCTWGVGDRFFILIFIEFHNYNCNKWNWWYVRVMSRILCEKVTHWYHSVSVLTRGGSLLASADSNVGVDFGVK